jgi:methylated-DNA-[protein]-cysteine S-methyltransferase
MNLSILMKSPLGPIRITATAKGISAVHFLTDAEITELPDNINGTGTEKDGLYEVFGGINQRALSECTDGVVTSNALNCRLQLGSYFEGNLKQFDLPLAQDGTAFQLRVWQQLIKITYGSTVSYLTIAKRLGDPKTIRAAATANGRNNIAIIVPCHRVIGSSGELTGYAGGLDRKKWLLGHEQRFAHGLQTLF